MISVDGVNGPDITLGSLTKLAQAETGQQPMTQQKNTHSNKQNRLSILINRNGLSYLISDADNKTIVDLSSHDFVEFHRSFPRRRVASLRTQIPQRKENS